MMLKNGQTNILKYGKTSSYYTFMDIHGLMPLTFFLKIYVVFFQNSKSKIQKKLRNIHTTNYLSNYRKHTVKVIKMRWKDQNTFGRPTKKGDG